MTYSPPNIGIRPKYAEIWSVGQQRATNIILPPDTRLELAERAVQQAVKKWVEQLDAKLHLQLVSDVDIEGPHLCPLLEHNGERIFGNDMWIARATFNSRKPRLVREDFIIGQRRLSEDAGYDYQTWRNAKVPALTDDAQRTLQYVKDNKDQVYSDLTETEKQHGQSL